MQLQQPITSSSSKDMRRDFKVSLISTPIDLIQVCYHIIHHLAGVQLLFHRFIDLKIDQALINSWKDSTYKTLGKISKDKEKVPMQAFQIDTLR